MTSAFLEFSKSPGNDLSRPVPKCALRLVTVDPSCAPLDTILQRKAGLGKPWRIYHQPIEALVYGSIDAINRLAFNVAVELRT